MKRSQKKVITQKSKIIRFMRVSRNISQKEAARKVGVSEQAIGHYENGRMDISDARVGEFLAAYGFKESDYLEYLAGKSLPVISIKQECIHLLDQINEMKLRTVHAVLTGFLN